MQHITVRIFVEAGYSQHAKVQEGLQNLTEISAWLNMKKMHTIDKNKQLISYIKAD